MTQPRWDDNKQILTIASQMKPIVCRVDILRFVLFWLLTKPRRISIKSGHCPWGNSTAAIAETTVEAKVPAFWLVDPRVMRESCFIFVFVSLLRESHLLMLSVCRTLSYDRSKWVKKRPWRKKELTRAVKAFLSARLAALRTCRGVLSSLRTDESISMYSGYIETDHQKGVENEVRTQIWRT